MDGTVGLSTLITGVFSKSKFGFSFLISGSSGIGSGLK
jgi:hypothetical protein